MKPLYLTFGWVFALLYAGSCWAQNKVEGVVLDGRQKPLAGANVFVEGTYDGAVTDEQGAFQFMTDQQGKVSLQVTYLTHETLVIPVVLPLATPLRLSLKEKVNTLDAVVISAGTLEAGDKSRVSVLKPLDIVTTAGSAGNIIAALQTLPGTQSVGEDGRLFVRGGDASETQTFVDGLRVAQPYAAQVGNIPVRGRFSPFLFKGISFSTGGYSAEFGDALSGVLQLNTQDEPTPSKTDISLMSVGGGLGLTRNWNNQSLTTNLSYINLAPYQWVVPQQVDWIRPVQSASGEAVYRNVTRFGLWKTYVAFDNTTLDLNQVQPGSLALARVGLANNNLYINQSYADTWRDGWKIQAGMSLGYNQNRVHIDALGLQDLERAYHAKWKLRKNWGAWTALFGQDFFHTHFTENIRLADGSAYVLPYTHNLWAGFAEVNWALSPRWAFKAGARYAYAALWQQSTLRPRLSMAWKPAPNHQFSIAYGQFDQSPATSILKWSSDVRNAMATHYIANYQWQRDKQLLRLEAYYKQYQHLAQYNDLQPGPQTTFAFEGQGYAKGLELFWRDSRSWEGFEYWVSYSAIDAQRQYLYYPSQVTPNFVATHTLSIVTKYWINRLKSQVGFTWNYNSGRPFNNPNQAAFMADRAPDNANLSFNWAYLLGPQKILYFSASNLLGRHNVFGYQYSNTPNALGQFDRTEITQTADRFFFVGFFWTISADKKDNQLKNL